MAKTTAPVEPEAAAEAAPVTVVNPEPLPVVMQSEWKGFWPKAALGAFGIMFTMMVSYFIWLGTAMVEVRAKVNNIEVTVKSLSETRRATAAQSTESNRQRLDALEESDGPNDR